MGSPAVAGAVAFLGAAAEWFDNAVAALGGGIVGSMDVVLWWGNHLNGSRRGGAKRGSSRHNGVAMQLGGGAKAIHVLGHILNIKCSGILVI